jgi:hypothetical protein
MSKVYLAFPHDDAALRALVEKEKERIEALGYGFAFAYTHGAPGIDPCLVLTLPDSVDPKSLIPDLEFSEVVVKEGEENAQPSETTGDQPGASGGEPGAGEEHPSPTPTPFWAD